MRSTSNASTPASRCGPGRTTGGADRPRREPRARTVGDEVVGRRADDRDVEAGELGRILRQRHAAEREEARRSRACRAAAASAPADRSRAQASHKRARSLEPARPGLIGTG